jgi:hypothetical protein
MSEKSVSFLGSVAVKGTCVICSGPTLVKEHPTVSLSPTSQNNLTEDVFTNSLAYAWSFPK